MNGYSQSLLQETQKGEFPSSRPINTKPSLQSCHYHTYEDSLNKPIHHVLCELGIKTSSTPATTLRRVLSHPKDPVQPLEKNWSGLQNSIYGL